MVAEWLTSIGVTAVLLKYRVPQRPGDAENRLPLQDAQRALSLARGKASEWGIDPARIGFMGFSAGGHLVANASTNFDRRAYEPVDSSDQVSCRPDFAVLIYPGGVLDKQDKEKLSPQIRVTKETPPSFLAVASDDKGSAPGTIRLFQSLRDAGVSAEIHVYASGGHGFGMRKSDQACASWPQRCEEWMRARPPAPKAKNVPIEPRMRRPPHTFESFVAPPTAPVASPPSSPHAASGARTLGWLVAWSVPRSARRGIGPSVPSSVDPSPAA